MKKNILIIQPGRFGDIVICLPIAKYYFDAGYEVDWLVPPEYVSMFRNINYCTPIDKINQHYYDVIDLSFGFNGPPEAWWQVTKPRWSSFVEAKYFLAHTPLEEKWSLSWERDTDREDELFDKLDLPSRYLVYHDDGSQSSFNLELPAELDKIKFSKVEDYTVFDWYKVLEKAEEIHCIDSLLCNFVDAAFPDKEKRIFHDIRQTSSSVDRTIIRGWDTQSYEN